MGENLGELQRRMLDRQQQHYVRIRIVNGIILAVTTFTASIVCVMLWRQMSHPEYRAGHTVAYVIPSVVDPGPCSSVIASRTCGAVIPAPSAFPLPLLDYQLPTVLAMTGQSRRPSASAWNEGFSSQ